jgi:broad specificity phosphatase PhoE
MRRTVHVRAVPVVDELAGHDGAVVLVASGPTHRVVRLSVLGETVRRLATGGIDAEDLVVAVRDALGEPPGGDARTLVEDAVRGLRDVGLVVVDER